MHRGPNAVYLSAPAVSTPEGQEGWPRAFQKYRETGGGGGRQEHTHDSQT